MSNNRELEPFRSWLIGIFIMVYLPVSNSVNAELAKQDVLSDFNVAVVTHESVIGVSHSF